MAKVKNISDFRSLYGAAADGYSDEELATVFATATGMPVDRAFTKLGVDTAKGAWSERAGAGIDSYQAGLYGVGEAVTGAVGLDSASEYLGKRRRANEIQADVSGRRAKAGGIPDSWEDVDGVGSGAK